MIDSVLVSLMLLGNVSTSGVQPFWAVTDRYGLMPQGDGVVGVFNARKEFNPEKTFQWHAGTSLAGNLDRMDSKFHPMVDELYAGIRWKVLTLDLGMKHNDAEFRAGGDLGSISATGGSVVWTGNARTMPGYTITLSPWEIVKRRLWIEGAFGDYKTMDDRYVANALVHNTRIGLTVGITSRFRFGIHFNHYAMWGGFSPDFGEMPATFDNYLRVIFGRSASSSGTASDQKNVIGNQLGGEKFKFEYLGNGWKATAQHDIPYDDGSGMGFQNFPDGVNTLCFSFDDKERWVSDLLYEFTYTKCQSGPLHSAVDEKGQEYILGGNDNYFNNQEYISGWTYYGRIIGLPLFLPAPRNADGVTPGISSNRIRSHHVGIAGKLFRFAPYRLMMTLTSHFGTFKNPIPGAPLRQFSFGLDGEVPVTWGSRQMLTFKYGFFFDAGDVLQPGFGTSIGLCFRIF